MESVHPRAPHVTRSHFRLRWVPWRAAPWLALVAAAIAVISLLNTDSSRFHAACAEGRRLASWRGMAGSRRVCKTMQISDLSAAADDHDIATADLFHVPIVVIVGY